MHIPLGRLAQVSPDGELDHLGQPGVTTVVYVRLMTLAKSFTRTSGLNLIWLAPLDNQGHFCGRSSPRVRERIRDGNLFLICRLLR